MKKEYIKPALQDIQITTSEIIATSSITGETGGEGKDNVEFESAENNREWGNLWK